MKYRVTKRQTVYDGSRRHAYEPLGDVGETVQSFYGTGGGNVPIVVEQFVLELDATIKIGGVLLYDWRDETSAGNR